MKIITCAICETVVERTGRNQKYCPDCSITQQNKHFKDWHETHKQHHYELQKINHKKTRLEVLKHYSSDTPSCECCGESHLEFLSIDHINGGGYEHKKEHKGKLTHWLKSHGFPPGFRVLCHNCNQAMGLYGYCPHTKVNDATN